MKAALNTARYMDPSSEFNHRDIVIAGFGSPHGDDQAGWQVVDLLAGRAAVRASAVKINVGTQLLDALDGCSKLFVVDACRGSQQIGAITRLEWPDPRIRQFHNHSTHGVGLCNALELADKLKLLPQCVEIFGIETGSHLPMDDVSPEVKQAVTKLEQIIVDEISRHPDARAVVS
jgi:hydrogenase maturation protease